MSIKAVLFDLDGTLANSLFDLAASTNFALDKFGYPSQPAERFKLFAGDGIPKMIERAMPQHEVSVERISELKNLFLTHYAEHYADNTVAYDGMCELVSELKQKGYFVAVVTNKAQEMAEVVVNKLYGDVFHLIYGQREGIPTKPDPTLTLMAMETLGVKPEECVFVGDSGMDVITGVNSGAYPIGVLWGFRESKELLSGGAKSLVQSSGELLNTILSL